MSDISKLSNPLIQQIHQQEGVSTEGTPQESWQSVSLDEDQDISIESNDAYDFSNPEETSESEYGILELDDVFANVTKH